MWPGTGRRHDQAVWMLERMGGPSAPRRRRRVASSNSPDLGQARDAEVREWIERGAPPRNEPEREPADQHVDVPPEQRRRAAGSRPCRSRTCPRPVLAGISISMSESRFAMSRARSPGQDGLRFLADRREDRRRAARSRGRAADHHRGRGRALPPRAGRRPPALCRRAGRASGARGRGAGRWIGSAASGSFGQVFPAPRWPAPGTRRPRGMRTARWPSVAGLPQVRDGLLPYLAPQVVQAHGQGLGLRALGMQASIASRRPGAAGRGGAAAAPRRRPRGRARARNRSGRPCAGVPGGAPAPRRPPPPRARGSGGLPQERERERATDDGAHRRQLAARGRRGARAAGRWPAHALRHARGRARRSRCRRRPAAPPPRRTGCPGSRPRLGRRAVAGPRLAGPGRPGRARGSKCLRVASGGRATAA